MAEGCAWLAVCITGVSTLRRRRAARASDLSRPSVWPLWAKSL